MGGRPGLERAGVVAVIALLTAATGCSGGAPRDAGPHATSAGSPASPSGTGAAQSGVGKAPSGAGTAPAGTAGPVPSAGGSAGQAQGNAAAAPPGAAAAGSAVLIGAGDIATCEGSADDRTAALVAAQPGTVFTLGDNAYPDGTAADFQRCYGPGWGRFRGRTRPAPGNHEYHVAGAAPYFAYFGRAAGPRGRGYYSYNVGGWHVVVLNTNCGAVAGGCRTGSPQQRWLRADLAASGARCTVAIVHHPLFTSVARHPPDTATRPLVRTLYAAGAELLLAGHNHTYERFAPQDADGRSDPARGIRAFVVGTGGAPLHTFGRRAAHSQVRNDRTFGVLKLTLSAGAYRWQFLAVPGSHFTDSGGGTCH
ncbi:metallophosphoesterase family protein [Krasilnikovia sp. MM14-A1259]|uniref:metallophosphoesterase family protein n=1 Tax=Krasilnikovia sp. MM14-A1259 TaxID=3373539 RepID=UPI0037F440B9